MAICGYCGRSIEGIVAQPRRFKAVQNSLPGIRMIKVHFVGVRAIFGTRSDKESPSPAARHPLVATDLLSWVILKWLFAHAHTKKTVTASPMISFLNISVQ